MLNTKPLGPHVHGGRSWIVSRLWLRARPRHGNQPTTSLPSHPPLNCHRNRPRLLPTLNRSQQHRGPATDRALTAAPGFRFSDLCRSVNPNQRELHPRLLYPSLLSQSCRPLRRTGRQKSSFPGTSHSRTSWEIRFPHSRHGDKDLRYSRPHHRPILTSNPRLPKERKGRANKNRLCSPLEASRRNFVTAL